MIAADYRMPAFAGMTKLLRRRFRLAALQVLIQPRHDLHEVARPVPVIELIFQDLIPGIAAGTGRTGYTENISRARHSGGGARLNRGGADLAEAHHVKERGEAFHLLL